MFGLTKGRSWRPQAGEPPRVVLAAAGALVATAALSVQILAAHRLTGKATPPAIALAWAAATAFAWALASLPTLAVARRLRARIARGAPLAISLLLVAIGCVVAAAALRALADPLLPEGARQLQRGGALWTRYVAGWSGPGMLVATALVLVPVVRAHLVSHSPQGMADVALETSTAVARSPEPLDQLIVRVGDRSVAVRLAAVGWIAAAGNYVELHTSSGRHVARITMAELEQRLDARCFVRVHRSAIVAIDAVRECRPRRSGGSELVLSDGSVVPLSRVGRKALERRLGASA